MLHDVSNYQVSGGSKSKIGIGDSSSSVILGLTLTSLEKHCGGRIVSIEIKMYVRSFRRVKHPTITPTTLFNENF